MSFSPFWSYLQKSLSKVDTFLKWTPSTVDTLFGPASVRFKKFSLQLRINPHMYKIGPRGPRHYIFGDHFYSKKARKLRFHVFLLFHIRKHMTSSFYLKWIEFTRNCEFVPNLIRVPGDPQLKQNSRFLVNLVHCI